MILYDDQEEPVDITKLAATELADHCIDLFEQIQHEKNKILRRNLISRYDAAAKYYNSNINNVMKLWKN